MTELTCQACGHQGIDVQSRIVEVTPTRNVTVFTNTPPVPERFRLEARCSDKYECEERQFEREPA